MYTSIIPSLILPGIGDAIINQKCPKILLLNSCWDRETYSMTATDFVIAIMNALKQSQIVKLHNEYKRSIKSNNTNDDQTVNNHMYSGSRKENNSNHHMSFSHTNSYSNDTVSSNNKNYLVLKDRKNDSFMWPGAAWWMNCLGNESVLDKDTTQYVTDVLYVDADDVTSTMMTTTDISKLNTVGVRVHSIPPAVTVSSGELVNICDSTDDDTTVWSEQPTVWKDSVSHEVITCQRNNLNQYDDYTNIRSCIKNTLNFNNERENISTETNFYDNAERLSNNNIVTDGNFSQNNKKNCDILSFHQTELTIKIKSMISDYFEV